MTARLRRYDGTVQPLAASAWAAPATPGERGLLHSLPGPVLDLGCGPGRLVEALAEAGIPALGVDASRHAVQQAARRGAPVLQRSVFDPLPGEGRWSSVLLFDGNIGIGGSPGALLARAATLVAPHGRIVVETDPPGAPTTTSLARLERDNAPGSGPATETTPWFPWAWVGAHDVDRLADAAGLRRVALHIVEGRWFTMLAAEKPPARREAP